MKREKLAIRPYARLLTMLGEQLIKNERTALVELIKNSYDADADRVEIRFENFNDDMSKNKDSRIIVEDNGSGMTPDVIRNAWMNPATPQKYTKKKERKAKTPLKKRIIQGEKGIGRFAILKLGKKITIKTRARNSEWGSVLEYDFTNFDDDFIAENEQSKEIFLDEIKIDYSESASTTLIKEPHGTLIEIRELKEKWSQTIVDKLCRDISSLTDPVSRITGRTPDDDFRVSVICNGNVQKVENESVENLQGLIDNQSVLQIEGEFDSQKNAFVFTEHEDKNSLTELHLDDPKIKGLWLWKRFMKERARDGEKSRYECGNFKFRFYIFDFSIEASGKYKPNLQQKILLKEHRIYLYRDGVRVYPYGDPDDDWLKIDVDRGTGRAGDFFSNDQLIGWIDISYEHNPDLRDKTNREGLIEKGDAVSDFVFLIPLFLSYIKQYPYSRYQQKQRDKNINEMVRSEVIANHLADLKTALAERGDKAGVRQLGKIEKKYKREKTHLVQRAEITEDLAGVGLSVEMTSHDIMLMMGRTKDIGKEIARLSGKSGNKEIQEKADMLVGVLDQITDGMQDVQSLFKSSKRRKKALRIEPILDKIFQLYEGLLKKKGIHYEKHASSGSPLVADTTDGVVMQVLINLFDNASYWLDTVNRKNKQIMVALNGDAGELVFSDNGPGIDKEDLPYIFEPFYSGKGQQGRGLGLYIARQLLERHDYSISIASSHQRKQEGANFVISFSKED